MEKVTSKNIPQESIFKPDFFSYFKWVKTFTISTTGLFLTRQVFLGTPGYIQDKQDQDLVKKSTGAPYSSKKTAMEYMFASICHFVPYFHPHSAQAAAALTGCSGWTGSALVAGIFPGGILAVILCSDLWLSQAWQVALCFARGMSLTGVSQGWGLAGSLIP